MASARAIQFLIAFGVFCVGMLLPSIALSAAVKRSAACSIPPMFWCDSEASAKLCGVADQCKAFATNSWNKKVRLIVVYEPHNHDCWKFIIGQLLHAFYDLREILDLELNPYGTTSEERVGNYWKFQCDQTGDECSLNILDACALKYLGKPETYLPFTDCMQNQSLSKSAKTVDASKQCLDQNKISPETQKRIEQCISSNEGKELMHEYGEKSRKLSPENVKHVPWIVLNEHSSADMQQFQDKLGLLICKIFYRGDNAPDACSTY